MRNAEPGDGAAGGTRGPLQTLRDTSSPAQAAIPAARLGARSHSLCLLHPGESLPGDVHGRARSIRGRHHLERRSVYVCVGLVGRRNAHLLRQHHGSAAQTSEPDVPVGFGTGRLSLETPRTSRPLSDRRVHRPMVDARHVCCFADSCAHPAGRRSQCSARSRRDLVCGSRRDYDGGSSERSSSSPASRFRCSNF